MNYTPEFMTGFDGKVLTLTEVNRAIDNKNILESLVISCDGDLNLELKMGEGIIGKIAFDEVEYRFDGASTKEIAALSKVGRHVQYIPTAINQNEDGTYLVTCSRKLAQKECYDNYISKLVPGDIIDAKITSIENYGVFCDIGCGIIALLPTKLISVTHIINPKDILDVSANLKVVVRKVKEDGKIELTHRELLGTWKEEASNLSVGKTVVGTVLSVEDYGTFVRLSQNLSGLASPTPGVELNPGDMVSVHINSIYEDTLKVKLSIVSKIGSETEKLKFKYYTTSGHIDEWVYSDGKKSIKTDFNNID